MARAGIGPIVADRVASKPASPPPPKFTIPPMFTPPPPPPPPKFTIPPKFTPPPPSVNPDTVERRAQAAIARDQVTSKAAFEASGMSLTQYMRTLDSKTEAPPPPMFTPMFAPPPVKADPPKPFGLPQTPDAIEKWLDPKPGNDEGSSGGDSVQAVPVDIPTTPPPPPPAPKVKVAPIDTVLFNDDSVPKEIIADLLFEDIGGQEILTIARHDTVNGQSVLYQPIKNINILQQQYNSNSLVRLRDTSDAIFGNFPINLSNKIPQNGNGPGGSNIYLDADGNLIIEFINLGVDELVDIQIASSGTIEEAG